LLFGNLWKSNADTAYAFGVAGSEMFERPTKIPFIVGGSIIGTALALGGLQNHLVGYLDLLGTFIPPLRGIIIADVWFRWRSGIPNDPRMSGFDWPHLVVHVVAGFGAWLSAVLSIGIAPLNGIILAVLWPALVYTADRQRR